MEPSQQADLLLLEVGRAISAKNAETVRGAIAQLQSLLDTLKAADAAEETAEGAPVTEAAISPDHGAMTGEHSHPHPAYGSQGGDAMHAHQHSHANDATHQHSHESMSPAMDQTPPAEAARTEESTLQEVELLEYAPLVGVKP